MSVSIGRKTMTLRLLCGAAACAISATGAYAQSIDDEIVVTAQRQEQSVQDVPIAVSAFSGDDLASRQLESFQDIQFNIPNFAFSRTQFTASTISIRGIGALAVGASTEPSTSIHLNEFYVNAPRLFETEFFDIERLEILRGPQGTLFGRNATGGVVNVITNKASTDGVEGYADAEYGNFNSVKVQGALNLPLSDSLAVRFAGTTIQRDGFTENLFDGRDFDDRNIYALRGSARWLPTDNTTIDFTASYMREDDNRARYQKQACTEGTLSPLLGCDPNGPLEFGRQDLRGTFFANTAQQTFAGLISPAAAAYGLFNINTPQLGTQQPADPRQVIVDTRPKYDAEETIFQLTAKHDFEGFSVKFTGGWGNSKIATRTDFDGGVGPELTVPQAVCFGAAPSTLPLPAVCNLLGGPGGPASFPLSAFDVGITGPNGLVGVIGGNVQSRSSNFQATDLSIGETDYWSAETILTTDFDSRVNFLLGVSHSRSNGYADYGVNTTGLDYFAYTGGTVAAASQAFVTGCVAGGGTVATCSNGTAPPVALGAGAGAFSAAATQGFSFYVPYFFVDSEDVSLESTAAFGEIYVDITDTLKLTGGIRYNWDTKGAREREALLTSASNAGAFPVVPFGTPSVRGLLDVNELVPCTVPGPATEPASCPGDPTGGLQDFRISEGDFNALTGRGVLQWTPSDDVQVYVSWTRGYKPGGFNPPTTSTAIAATFDPEIIKAYEIGLKSNLGGSLQANLTGFYYDYTGLQISRIINNSSINDNINATIWGLEGEFVWRPTDRLIANLNASYLNTEVGAFSTFDARNPTAGAANVELVSNLSNSLDCVITRTGPTPLLITNGGAPTGVTAIDALRGGLGGIPGVGAFSNCDALAANIGTINALIPGQGYAVVGGVDQDLSGNELPGSPDFKIAGGLQYEFAVGENYSLTPRVDAYYQSAFFTNVFNTQQDNFDAYAYVNAQIKFGPTEGNWTARVFMQNVTNEDAVTGSFGAGQGAGNFTNLFLLEPRRWGVGINMVF